MNPNLQEFGLCCEPAGQASRGESVHEQGRTPNSPPEATAVPH